MLPASGGGGGLARYRSAPATWLEALLEADEEQSELVLELPKPPPPNIDADLEFLESPAAIGGLSSFLRQNSSPADFLSLIRNSDGCFSSLGIPADYVSPPPSVKRAREAEDFDMISGKFFSSSIPVKIERGVQLQDTLDVEMDKLLKESVICRTRAKHGCATHPRSIAERKIEEGVQLQDAVDVEMDKLLKESVICRTRAKRGCATHPRSIAERVRRTKISDKIRKLQELVPNMDKPTNTADMLVEAVAYVKFLQKQIQELKEIQKDCKCSSEE